MSRKYRTMTQRKMEVFQAVSAMKLRGCPSVTVAMIMDEIAFDHGLQSAKCSDGRSLCRGLGRLLMELIRDGDLYTTNDGHSIHIAGPTPITNDTGVNANA